MKFGRDEDERNEENDVMKAKEGHQRTYRESDDKPRFARWLFPKPEHSGNEYDDQCIMGQFDHGGWSIDQYWCIE